jgi:hypothetical protein
MSRNCMHCWSTWVHIRLSDIQLKRMWTQVLQQCMQFLLIKWHPSCWPCYTGHGSNLITRNPSFRNVFVSSNSISRKSWFSHELCLERRNEGCHLMSRNCMHCWSTWVHIRLSDIHVVVQCFVFCEVFCPLSNYSFWFPVWYLQTFLAIIYKIYLFIIKYRLSDRCKLRRRGLINCHSLLVIVFVLFYLIYFDVFIMILFDILPVCPSFLLTPLYVLLIVLNTIIYTVT